MGCQPSLPKRPASPKPQPSGDMCHSCAHHGHGPWKKWRRHLRKCWVFLLFFFDLAAEAAGGLVFCNQDEEILRDLWKWVKTGANSRLVFHGIQEFHGFSEIHNLCKLRESK